MEEYIISRERTVKPNQCTCHVGVCVSGSEVDSIISLPGHTPGGICLLLKEKRVLFTGDSINHHLWMQLKESLPLKTFLENLNRISWVTERADRILHGHAQDFDDILLFDDLKAGIKELIETKGKSGSKEYKWFGGISLCSSP